MVLILLSTLMLIQCSSPIKFAGSTPAGLSGSLYQPEGPGPFPAVILMHGCGGDHAAYHQWAELLKKSGFVALVLDSFTTRGVTSVCGRKDASPTFQERVGDALNARSYLQSLSFVDGKKIALMGWSHGGVSALIASLKKGEETFSKGEPFAAVVAFYPYCFPLEESWSLASPLLILIGTADDWTPSGLCETFTATLKEKNQDISLTLYDGATHAFDFGVNMTVQGHVLKHSPQAVEDAEKRVLEFLSQKLK